MAYQKLQAGKAFTVNPSDNTGLPDPGLKGPSGATTGTGGGGTQIIDANRTGDDINTFSTLKFTLAGVKPGMIAINTTDGTQSEVVQVVAHAYNGTTFVGYVPTGGSASTFLRGDGTWVTQVVASQVSI